jgi:hypothetical protein
MIKNDPEQLILSWLDQMPKKHRDTLVSQYIFMTCTDSGDLALSGDEGWQYFRKMLTEPDFPLRRVARLLTTRSLLSFVLDLPSANAHWENLPNESDKTMTSLDAAQYLRAGQHFQKMIQSDLSDAAISEWLLDLEGRF